MEEQVSSHLNDLEGLNSELEGFLSDLHGREETLASRVKGLEEELSAARASAAAELRLLAQKETSLTAALEGVRSTLARESTHAVALTSERDELQRRLDAATRQLEDTRISLSGKLEVLTERFDEAKSAVAEKEALLTEARAAAKEEAAKMAAVIEEARSALARECSKLSAATLDRDDLERRLQGANELLGEAKAALAEKDVLLKETRAAARERASELAAELDKARASLQDGADKISALVSERDGLLERLREAGVLLTEEKAASDKKDALLKEARASVKEKVSEFNAALDQAHASVRAETERCGELVKERDALLRQLEESASLLEEEKAGSAKKDEALTETKAAARAKAAELTAAIEQLKASVSDADCRAGALASERDGLQRQLADFSELFKEEKAASAKRDEALKEARAAAREKAEELGAVIEQLKISISDREAAAAALASERDDLLRQVEADERLLDGEKARSAEKELLINSGRAALKAKEEEIGRILRGVEELRADVALERATVKDREAQLQKAARLREGLEKKLDLAAEESSRSEEGFLLKVELVKKEMREQAKRADELERKLAAAGARLDDALDEASRKEKLLAETSAALADKEAQLKAANLKLKELTKEFAEIKSGSLQENAARARETAAAMAARVEELENSLSENATRHMDKFRAVQAELSSSKAELRAKEEENAALLAREDTISKELGDAEEKWKFATAQLNNSASKLRNAENEMEIIQGRMRSLEEERDKFRAAAIKAETSASALAAQEARARDGEVAGLMAALEEQAGKYTDLLRKYDDIVLLNESLAREKAAAKTDADSLRDAFKAAQAAADAEAGEKRGVQSSLAERLRIIEAQLKKKEYELEEARSSADIAAREAEELRQRLDEETVSAESAVEGERERYAALLEKAHQADALLKKQEFELAEARAAAANSAREVQELREGLQKMEDSAAGKDEGERERYVALLEKARKADALLKKQEFELAEARAAADNSAREAIELRARLEEKEDSAAGEAEAERERYAVLSEKMHNAEALLKRKEFELEEAKGSLSILEGECSMLRDSRAALGEKYAREIQSENELLRQAQGRISERDSVISRLTATEEELKKESEALRKEKQSLISLMRKKSSGPAHSAKVSEAERMLGEKESRLVKLRAELENTRAEKAELQGREKELREELKSRPYRAMLREAEEKLLIKEKMLSDMTSRMQRIGKDFEELKVRGHSAGAPGYLPDFEELVAGVAHQVANSISIIRSHAEFCTEAPDSEGARESLDVIVRNIVNLQKKIDIIMNFSRPVIPQRSPERLGAVLSEVLDGLRASGRLDNVKIKIKGGDKLKPVNLDRVRFEAALEQLLINAAEAMPGGGELNASVSGGPGRQRLEISDNGAGIEKKNLGSVFHPFFTTKPGKMGLGLTLARNVVRAHGGTLELHSEAGKGTRVVMELPEIS